MGETSTIQQVPTRWKTSDGAEHKTPEAAKRHQRLIDAEAEYERAKQVYERALAETQTTADGKPFRLGVLTYYYIIHIEWSGRPVLSQVSYGHDTEVYRDGDHVLLVVQDYRGHDRTYTRRKYRISDLYADRRAANDALNAAQSKWLRQYVEDKPHLQIDLREAVAP